MAITYLSGERIQGIAGTAYPASAWTEIGNEWTLTGNQIDFALKRDGAYSTATVDTGSNISDTWVLRMHVNFTGNSSGDNYAYQAFWGFSSQPSNYYWSDTQDTAGFLLHFAGTGGSGDNRFAVSEGDNTTLEGDSSVTVSGHTVTPTGEWYIELKRTASATITLGLYTDATYGTLVSGTSVTSNTNFSGTGLRYLKFGTPNYSSQAEIQNGTVDTVEFYDNMTTATGTPTKFLTDAADEKATITNIPVGTRFEETDTRKIFRRKASALPVPDGLTASNYAIDTRGSGASYMRVNQSTDLLLSTGDMTWSFWFYPTVIPSGEAGFFKPNGGTLSVWCYLREVAQKMAMGLRGSGGTAKYFYGDTTPTVNKWNLATLSWDYSSETLKIYMNGREETVTTSGGPTGALGGNFQDFVFFSNTTTGSEDLDGYVAEVAMWEDYWPDDTNHDALWNSYNQSTNAGGKSCNDLGTTLNNKLRYFFTGEYANTTGDVILNQATGTDSESAIKGTPTNLSRLDGGNTWVEKGTA